jgi:hypothetical protein
MEPFLAFRDDRRVFWGFRFRSLEKKGTSFNKKIKSKIETG